ncbi:GH10319 [Drosophila grimshawi]|uniref:GH10319 n=1 Tax=Drosophila grimshawi TaxID=7222 RepID=B4JMB2_DROGR|nr:GH24612 [Drosophila grimshawi]EDW05188.1 GH10319 [Drosophila grimshawi]
MQQSISNSSNLRADTMGKLSYYRSNCIRRATAHGAEQYIKDIQREYVDFLDDDEDQGIYAGHVKDMLAEKSKRLVVNINDLKRKISSAPSVC